MHNAKKLATKKQACAACVCLFLKAGFWRRPTLPHGGTIGAEVLNCSVRDGKRCYHFARSTGNNKLKYENKIGDGVKDGKTCLPAGRGVTTSLEAPRILAFTLAAVIFNK